MGPEGNDMGTDNDSKARAGSRDRDEIKVTDRRLFTADGEPRGAIDAAETDEQASSAEAEPAESTAPPAAELPADPDDGSQSPGFERRPLDQPEGVDFTMLINAMAQPALIFLGELAHPGSGQQEVNLEQARLQIDLLDTLRIKSRGNLTPEEEGLLDRILYQLRMLYVQRSSEPSG
jgi:hypothetical protein